jgi:hypothetical protein
MLQLSEIVCAQCLNEKMSRNKSGSFKKINQDSLGLAFALMLDIDALSNKNN